MDLAPTPDERGTHDAAFTRAAFAGATTIFLVFGTTSSLYGPLLVTFAHYFHVSLPAAGAVLSVHFVGAFCGVPLAWTALQRYPARAVLIGALVTMALGAAGAALARGFYELLASVVVIGLGFGAMDFSLNSLLVRLPAVSRPHRLSVANAGYSVGSIVGPLLVVAARPANYPLLFAGVAIAALSLTASTGGAGAPKMARAHPQERHPRRRAALGVFVAAYVLYVATESSAAGWIAPQLHRVGYSTVNRRRRDGGVLARPSRRPLSRRAGAPTRQRPQARARQPRRDRCSVTLRFGRTASHLLYTPWPGSAWRSSTRWGSSGSRTSTRATATD